MVKNRQKLNSYEPADTASIPRPSTGLYFPGAVVGVWQREEYPASRIGEHFITLVEIFEHRVSVIWALCRAARVISIEAYGGGGQWAHHGGGDR